MINSKKLSISKIKKTLTLFKFVVSQRSDNQTTALSFLNENSINDISESIYNILYNENLNLNLSKARKAKLKKSLNQIHESLKTYQKETFL